MEIVLSADCPLKLAVHVYVPALAAEIWDICTMLVLVPSASHIWVKVIPGGRVHCHWKEPSLATVQERLAADTTLSGPGGTGGSNEGGCRNVTGDMGRGTEKTRYRTESQSFLEDFSRLRATWCHYTYTLLSPFSPCL